MKTKTTDLKDYPPENYICVWPAKEGYTTCHMREVIEQSQTKQKKINPLRNKGFSINRSYGIKSGETLRRCGSVRHLWKVAYPLGLQAGVS